MVNQGIIAQIGDGESDRLNSLVIRTSKPVGFELSSNMHMYYVFWTPYLFFIINDHLCPPCLAEIFYFLYLCL